MKLRVGGRLLMAESCGSDSFPKAANDEHGSSAEVRYAGAIPEGSHRPLTGAETLRAARKNLECGTHEARAAPVQRIVRRPPAFSTTLVAYPCFQPLREHTPPIFQ